MAEKKRKKLSLKRKTISSKSLLFNSIGQRLESLQADDNDKAAENNIINLSSDSDTDGDLTEKQPKKRSRFSDISKHSDGGGLKNDSHDAARSIQFQSGHVFSGTTKQSLFLDVDEDLRKLRMMFLKFQAPKIDVRALSDLPEFTTAQTVQIPESNEDEKENTVLSALPAMCEKCLRRKPSDYSKLYDDIIKQELQTDSSLSEHQRSSQSFTKGHNSGCRGISKGETGLTGFRSSSEKKTDLKKEEFSFPKRNMNLSSEFSSPIQGDYGHRVKKCSSIDSQNSSVHSKNDNMKGENGKANIPANQHVLSSVSTQPVNIQQGSVRVQPVKIPADCKMAKSDNYLRTQPTSSAPHRKIPVHSVERNISSREENVTRMVRTGPASCPPDRTHSEVRQSVKVKRQTVLPSTETDSKVTQHKIVTPNVVVFKGKDSADSHVGKSDVTKPMSESSSSVQCCPLCPDHF
ncbi:uncharacterized protein LOC117345067 [Pecten maximus]|uniref:uncharacterized protein LOC117345067 n=1 Tax=Pecten maximus TaxID=6579 RepID=UPI00145866CF|nr:uncharacterized protein LOC117345067 [Pecten maximus]